MARTAEFDRDRAFRRAFDLFWRRGYGATALPRLLESMCIARSSFYAAFGSKESLFRDVLAEYGRRTRAALARIREDRRGLSALRTFLDETLLDVPDAVRRMGCLAVNSVLELAGVDPPLQRAANQILEDLESEFRMLLEEARSLGEVRDDRSPAELARLTLTFVLGLRVACRRGFSRAEAEATIDGFLDSIASGSGASNAGSS